MIEASTLWKPFRWVIDWLRAAGDLGQMRRDIQDLKRSGGDPMRCTACGKRLKVTAIRDIEGAYGGVMGEYVTLKCETPDCVFTPRERDIRFPE